MEANAKKRFLILASKLGYQTRAFADAAAKLGVEVAFGTDRCHKLENPWGDGALALHFENPQEAAEEIVRDVRAHPPDAILALGDRPTTTAARAAEALHLRGNPPRATEICGNKLLQREALQAAGLPVPEFLAFGLGGDLRSVLPRVSFPCVVKPLELAASQGVIRANNEPEFREAVRKIRALIESPEIQVTRGESLGRLLVEKYIPGREVAIEGVITGGQLRILAIFDKPDPLEGPYFEETIYVTPSRLSDAEQDALRACAARATTALGLVTGPIHAEFRINEHGPWVLEVAPRPIGGLCSRVLRFGSARIYLEELLVRHALEMEGADWPREEAAAGVMMIPVPKSGILERVDGIEEARSVRGVEGIVITARLHDFIAAWPEGSSYLGFIFARGERPEIVEDALREAHAKLRFALTPRLPVGHPVTRKMPA